MFWYRGSYVFQTTKYFHSDSMCVDQTLAASSLTGTVAICLRNFGQVNGYEVPQVVKPYSRPFEGTMATTLCVGRALFATEGSQCGCKDVIVQHSQANDTNTLFSANVVFSQQPQALGTAMSICGRIACSLLPDGGCMYTPRFVAILTQDWTRNSRCVFQ